MFKDNFFNFKIAEVEAVYNCRIKPSERVKISTSADVFNLLRDPWYDTIEHHESFGVLLLARDNSVLGIHWVSHGGICGTVVDIRLVFQMAIKCLACSIVCCHNHPSGNKQPSSYDDEITKKIKEAGKILDIQLLDHIILTTETYYSYADEGRL